MLYSSTSRNHRLFWISKLPVKRQEKRKYWLIIYSLHRNVVCSWPRQILNWLRMDGGGVHIEGLELTGHVAFMIVLWIVITVLHPEIIDTIYIIKIEIKRKFFHLFILDIYNYIWCVKSGIRSFHYYDPVKKQCVDALSPSPPHAEPRPLCWWPGFVSLR